MVAALPGRWRAACRRQLPYPQSLGICSRSRREDGVVARSLTRWKIGEGRALDAGARSRRGDDASWLGTVTTQCPLRTGPMVFRAG